MKVKKTLMAMVALGTLITGGSVWATPIQIPLSQDSFPPFGDLHISTVITNTVAAYNLANDVSFSIAISNAPAVKVATLEIAPIGYPSFGAETLGLGLPIGDLDYLFLHWGGPEGGVAELWYLGDSEAGSEAFFSAPDNHALSFYSYYGPAGETPPRVPDGGGMFSLLGGGLLGVLLLARRRASGRASSHC